MILKELKMTVGTFCFDIMVLRNGTDGLIRHFLFVAIDQCSRWVHMRVFEEMTDKAVVEFLNELVSVAPFKIQKVITDSSVTFVNEQITGSGKGVTGKEHPFSKACRKHQINHRNVSSATNQISGMTERFLGKIERNVELSRIGSVMGKTTAVQQYREHYLRTPQIELGGKTPMEMLLDQGKPD